MKSVKPLLVALGITAVLAGVFLALASQPAVQAWALRRLLAGQPVRFETVSASPGRVTVTGLRYARDGVQVGAARIEADYSLWRLLFARELVVGRAEVSGLVVDASRLSGGRAGAGVAAAPAAPGAVAGLSLPFGLVADRLSVAGRLLLPGPAGEPAIPADFALEGGGIAPEREGALRWTLTVVEVPSAVRVGSLRAEGELILRQTAGRTFDRAQLTVVVAAEGTPPGRLNRLRLVAGLESGASGSTYALTVDALPDGGPANLVRIRARQADGAAPFEGDWSLQVDRAQVEPFFLGGRLPEFSLAGTGGFQYRPAAGAATIRGGLRGEFSSLEAWQPAWAGLGRIRLDTEFDLAGEDGAARVERLRLRIEGDGPALTLETRHALVFDRRTRAFRLGRAAEGEIGRLTLREAPLAWLRPFVSGLDSATGSVSGDFALTNGDRELRLQSLAPLRIAGLNVAGGEEPLLREAALSVDVAAVLAPEATRLDLTGLKLGTAAGDRLDGSLAVELPHAAGRPARVQSSLTADLPRLLGPLAGVGHVKLDGALEASLLAGRLQVDRARAVLADGAGRALVSGETARVFVLDLRTLQPVDAGPGEAVLAKLAVARLDLAALPAPGLAARLRGESAPADFILSARGPRLVLRSSAPVQVSAFGWRQGGTALLEGLSLEAAPVFESAGLLDWQLTAGGIQLRTAAGATVAGLTAEAGLDPAQGLRASLTWNADLAALAGQPAFAVLRPLSAGRASGEIRAARTTAGLQAEARATLNGLVAREGNQPLPVANLGARALLAPDGRFTLEVPLLLDRAGQRSDLRLAVEATRQADGIAFDATLSSQHLELLDVPGLAAFLAGTPAPAATPSRAPAAAVAVPGAEPFWRGYRGRFSLDLQSVTRGPDWKLTGLTGRAELGSGGLTLQKLEGAINRQGRLGAEGRLRFTGGARPYALDGSFTLSEFDLGALLKVLEPDRPPTIEGVFGVTGRFAGTGATPGRALEEAQGQFQLTSRSGVFRGLRRASEKVSVATRAVELGAALGSLFGSSKVKEAAEKVAGQTYQVDQLAQTLAELPFDQLVVKLERDQRLDLRLDEVSLLSPEVRLTGRGTIRHEEGLPIARQPLSLALTLAARGKVEQQLARLRVLDGTKDDLGYAKMRETGPIGGSLLRPDPTLFFLRLLEGRSGGDTGGGGD